MVVALWPAAADEDEVETPSMVYERTTRPRAVTRCAAPDRAPTSKRRPPSEFEVAAVPVAAGESVGTRHTLWTAASSDAVLNRPPLADPGENTRRQSVVLASHTRTVPSLLPEITFKETRYK